MYNKSMVKNAPEYANEYSAWVATMDSNGDLWFYGAYSDMCKAVDVAIEIGGYTCR